MPESVTRWQAVVIGGGLAGCAVAIRLALAGQQVLLLEKAAAAHDKVCGEFISADAQHYLHELGVDLAKLGAVPISKVRLIKRHKTVSANLPFQACSLSRRVLDEDMIQLAEQHGVRVLRACEAGALDKEPEGWRITNLGSEAVLADTVFLTTGKHDLRNWRRQGGVQNSYIAFKMHFRLTEQQYNTLREHIELTLFNGGYAGLEPIEDGKANFCLVVTKRDFSLYGKSWDSLLQAILKATPLLAERLMAAKPCWPRPLSIFGIPYGFLYNATSEQPKSLYRVGDQMAVIPSFCGYGMSIALHTAFLAVKCYQHSDDVYYHHQAHDDLQSLIKQTTRLSKMMEYSFMQEMALLAGRLKPNLISQILSHSRLLKSIILTELSSYEG